MKSKRSKRWRQNKTVREMETILRGPLPPIVSPDFNTSIPIAVYNAQLQVSAAKVDMFRAQAELYAAQMRATMEQMAYNAIKGGK